jgi:hypothetical protein
MPICGAWSQPQRFRYFRNTQANEISQLYHVRGQVIFGRQGIEGFMHSDDFGGRGPKFDSRFVKFFHLLMASPLLARFAARLVDQDLPHGFGCGAKEVAAVIPLLLPGSGQLEPGLMDESGGLERVAGIRLGHFASSQSAQFFIDQRQQFVGGL